MKPITLISVLLALMAGCRPQSELAPSSDEEMQHKIAGVWVHQGTLKSKGDFVATLELAPDGTYSDINTFSKPLPQGLSRIETSGRWRIENNFLIITETNSSPTNAHLAEEVRFEIVRLDDRELEYKPPETYEGFSVPTNHIVFRKATR
ncbi:MAG TPA: hypothetical protein VFW05_13905 [Verrucomicrobiae bacterium]|nr:hypothetical protein [Verrucomicrobiae bacterium]